MDNELILEIDWAETFLAIEQAIHNRDFDYARFWLQKFSYTLEPNSRNDIVNDRFKTLMTAFAKIDPLYNDLMPQIKTIAVDQPGIIQSSIYDFFPRYTADEIRYVLYFASELGHINRLKKGRSYQIFGPDNVSVVQSGQPIGNTIATYEIEIKSNPVEDKISSLQKKATSLKVIDWDAAIACLYEATDLMRRNESDHAIERWVRLPIFLQQGGYFEKAMAEFEKILQEIKPRIKRDYAYESDPNRIKMLIHADFCFVYNKMKVACKREKLLDQAKEYKRISEQHQLIVDEMNRLLSAH